MASQIIKQPNGKLAHFSAIANFTAFNMDQAEAVEFCINTLELSSNAAQAKVHRALDDVDPTNYALAGSGLDRWNEALSSIKVEHGTHAVQAILAGMEA